MDQQIVQAGGRQVVAQRFQRHATVARGKRDLFLRIAAHDRRPAFFRGQTRFSPGWISGEFYNGAQMARR
jgi:hypothetical protein